MTKMAIHFSRSSLVLITCQLLMWRSVCSSQPDVHFQYLTNHKIQTYYLRQSYTKSSINSCAYVCTKDSGCLSFQYCEYCEEQCITSSSRGQEQLNNHVDGDFFIKVVDAFNLSEEVEYFAYSVLNVAELALNDVIPDTSFHTCVEGCSVTAACSGVLYDPVINVCSLIDAYLDSHVTKEIGQGDHLLYMRILNTIAQGKAAVQSSTFYNMLINYNYEAENAVDGDYIFEASSSTNSEKQPYWMVNLGYECHIWAVKTFNSPQWFALYPIYNTMVYVGETDQTSYTSIDINERTRVLKFPICDYIGGKIDDEISQYECGSPMAGQYVYVEAFNNPTTYLYFREVEVFGIC